MNEAKRLIWSEIRKLRSKALQRRSDADRFNRKADELEEEVNEMRN